MPTELQWTEDKRNDYGTGFVTSVGKTPRQLKIRIGSDYKNSKGYWILDSGPIFLIKEGHTVKLAPIGTKLPEVFHAATAVVRLAVREILRELGG